MALILCMRHTRMPVLAFLACVALWITPAHAVDEDWGSYGRDYSEQHYSPLSQITTDNVSRLGLAWSLELPDTHGGATVPLAVNGILYFCVDQSIVRAVDADTGRQLWIFDPRVARAAGRKLRNGWGVRGLAYGNDSIYVGTMDGRLIAIDARSGRQRWAQLTVAPNDSRFISGAPRVFNNLVFIGHAGATYPGTRGYVTAYDARTGEQRWRFYTVPGDPKLPPENDAMKAAMKTWKGKWWEFGGGAVVWNAITIDTEQNLVYIGTSNGLPWNQNIRSPQGGDNLYVASIIALDINTGAYRWHYQTTPGDTWDYDSTSDIVLANLSIDGKPRKVILHAPKNGFFYVIDRTNGKVISAEPYTKVTWAERIDLRTGRPVETPGARYYESQPKLIWPSPSGGASWHPMAYSARTGLAYISELEIPGFLDDTGVTASNWIRPNGQYSTAVKSSASDSTVDAGKSSLVAWDPLIQKARWRVPTPGVWNGGTLATASDLVFQGLGTGEFIGRDARSGKRLWSFDAKMGISGAPISFSADGKQYIAVVAGWGGSGSASYGSLSAQYGWVSRVHSHRLLAFALDGSAKLPSNLPDRMLVKPVDDPSQQVDTQIAARGAELYSYTCLPCHGAGVVAAGFAPDLRASAVPLSADAFKSIVVGGALLERGMPRFEELSDSELNELREFSRRQARDPNGGPKQVLK
ncbi:MAG: PQQ-dependent dehydrogenase, methanol/ethanol family [Steroidobacteraceae bacterium]